MKLTKKVLKNQAKPITFEYPVKNQMLADDMFKFMQQENGIGLAAPQIGLSRRVFVIGIEQKLCAYFNPEITKFGQIKAEFNEGCLSFKGDQCTILRPAEISVQYQDHRGQWHKDHLQGLWARVFQHELDHLNGVTMWDRYKEQNAEQPRNRTDY